MGGQRINASIFAAPPQRNTDAEKADLRTGRIPEGWAANPAKRRQKDRDGRRTLKRRRRKPEPTPDGTLMMEIPTPVYGGKSHAGGLQDRSNTGSSVCAGEPGYRHRFEFHGERVSNDQYQRPLIRTLLPGSASNGPDPPRLVHERVQASQQGATMSS
jgi:hypothetical protein